MTFKISSKKIEEFIEEQHSIDGMVSIHDFELWLEEQPRVGEWIPCSERLPEEDERVLITTKTTVRVYFGTYTKRYGFSMREGFICAEGFMWLNTALAWMPLPPAYKEGENGDN